MVWSGVTLLLLFVYLQAKIFECLCRVKGRIDIRLLVRQRNLSFRQESFSVYSIPGLLTGLY
jgi:hypothetical protein